MGDILKIMLGAVLAVGGTIIAKLWEESRQRSAIRAAFRAEIGGLVQIAAIRKHRENFENWVERWTAGEDFVPRMFGVPADDDPVFSKNTDRIGLLGTDAADFVQFYTLLRALRVHFRAIQNGDLVPLSLQGRIVFAQKALEIGDIIEPLGKRLAWPNRKRAGLVRLWFAFSVLWSVATALIVARSEITIPVSAPVDYFQVPATILAPWIVTVAVLGVLWVIAGFRPLAHPPASVSAKEP